MFYRKYALQFVIDLVTEREGSGATLRKAGYAPVDFRKVFDGKLYDSKKMEVIGSIQKGDRDEELWEALYRTRKGQFLLEGQGLSEPWMMWCDGEAGWGHGFIPLTAEQARLWLELRGLDDELLAAFCEPEEA